jgi:hypothetical protein
MSGARVTTVADTIVKNGPSTRANLRVVSTDRVDDLMAPTSMLEYSSSAAI